MASGIGSKIQDLGSSGQGSRTFSGPGLTLGVEGHGVRGPWVTVEFEDLGSGELWRGLGGPSQNILGCYQGDTSRCVLVEWREATSGSRVETRRTRRAGQPGGLEPEGTGKTPSRLGRAGEPEVEVRVRVGLTLSKGSRRHRGAVLLRLWWPAGRAREGSLCWGTRTPDSEGNELEGEGRGGGRDRGKVRRWTRTL
eukprot:3844546-Rhodomonas_salina.2